MTSFGLLLGQTWQNTGMNLVIEGCHAKLERANVHLEELGSVRRSFLHDVQSRIVGNFDTESSEYVFRIDGDAPPHKVGVIVGEFANNLRSALDNLVCELVVLRGNKVKRNAFVIADTKKIWRNNEWKLQGLNADDKEKIHHLQPYHSSLQYAENPLARLGWLSNEDKHTSIHASYAIQTNVFPLPKELVAPIPDNETTGYPASGILNSGSSRGDRTEICRCFLDSPGPNPKMRLSGTPSIDIAFSDSERGLVFDDLNKILIKVTSIIELFEPEFD